MVVDQESAKLEATVRRKKTNRVNGGAPTNDLVFSAYQAPNSSVFLLILDLYVNQGSRIADVTCGKGVFWTEVDRCKYDLFMSDLRTTDLPEGAVGGIDCRALPYEDEQFDAVVFDPPYMHTPGGTAHNGHQNFEQYYANNSSPEAISACLPALGLDGSPKYHEAVLDLYYRGAKEAWRVLKQAGIYIVKCQDEVCSNQQRLTHIEITAKLQEYGFCVEDLFVVMRQNEPGVSRLKERQYHARKNHSYFMVYRKPKPRGQNGDRPDHSKKNSENGFTTTGGNSQLSFSYVDGKSK